VLPPTLSHDSVLVTASLPYTCDAATCPDQAAALRFDLSGNLLSTTVVPDAPIGPSALAKSGRYFVAGDGLFAIDGATVSWTAPYGPGGRSGSNAAIGPSGTIYVAERGPNTTNHHLFAFTTDGKPAWSHDLGASVISPLAVDAQERIYVMNGAGLLRALSAQGTSLWTFQSLGSGGGMIVDAQGVVYFGSEASDPTEFTGTEMYAVRDGGNGQGVVVWNVSVGFLVSATPALSAGGTLYIGNACKTFSALRASDGMLLWSFDEPGVPSGMCGGGWSSAALGADGTIYASVDGTYAAGTLYAFAGDATSLAQAPWPGEQHDSSLSGSLEP